MDKKNLDEKHLLLTATQAGDNAVLLVRAKDLVEWLEEVASYRFSQSCWEDRRFD